MFFAWALLVLFKNADFYTFLMSFAILIQVVFNDNCVGNSLGGSESPV